MKRAAIVAFLSALAILAAGCGGSDDAEAESTADWVDSFCTSINSWTNELTRIGEELGDISALSADSIRDAADEADAATQEFVDEVRSLGAPDTASGDEVQTELEQLADTVDEEREKLNDAAEEVEDVSDIAAAVTTLGSSITLLGTAIEESLEAIESGDAAGELETAFEESEACDEIRS